MKISNPPLIHPERKQPTDIFTSEPFFFFFSTLRLRYILPGEQSHTAHYRGQSFF